MKGGANALVSNGNSFVSAGKDGLVHFWSEEVTADSKPTKTVDLAAKGS